MATTVKKTEYFKILVDGKTFGPFPQSKRRRFQALRHRKGVVFTTVIMDQPPAEGRRQKAEGRTFSFRWSGLGCGTKTLILGGCL